WNARGLAAADAVRTVGSIMRVQQLLQARLEELLRPYGLTFARYEALLLLHFTQHGLLPLSRMGERLLVHPTAVTHTVARLEKQRFVVRKPDPSDRRTTLAAITDEGRAVATAAIRAVASEEFGLPGWSSEDLRGLLGYLERIRSEHGD